MGTLGMGQVYPVAWCAIKGPGFPSVRGAGDTHWVLHPFLIHRKAPSHVLRALRWAFVSHSNCYNCFQPRWSDTAQPA